MARSAKAYVTAAAVLLGVVALARAASDAQRQRVQAFQQEARSAREKLGLTREALVKQYPTPEIRLASPIPLAPGRQSRVAVGGAFQEKSLFVVESEDLAVTQEQLGPAGWSAQVAVRPGALPQQVGLTVYAPVSGIRSSAPAFLVAGRYECRVALKGGLSVRLVTRGQDPLLYDAVWTRAPASDPLRESVARLSIPYGGLGFEIQVDQAQLMQMAQEQQRGPQAEMMAEVKKCDQLPQAQMVACFQQAGERIKVLQAKAARQSVEKGPACGTLHLSRGRDGGFEGGEFRACMGGFEDRVASATCTPLEEGTAPPAPAR